MTTIFSQRRSLTSEPTGSAVLLSSSMASWASLPEGDLEGGGEQTNGSSLSSYFAVGSKFPSLSATTSAALSGLRGAVTYLHFYPPEKPEVLVTMPFLSWSSYT